MRLAVCQVSGFLCYRQDTIALWQSSWYNMEVSHQDLQSHAR